MKPVDPNHGKSLQRFFILAGIIALTFIVYTPVLNNKLLVSWDDDRYILDNPYIKSLDPASTVRIFSIYYDGHYHPLTLMSLAANYQAGGVTPGPYHLTNIVFHLLNTLLVFFFFYYLFGEKRFGTAALVSLLFGLGSMQVESVAWATERKNVQFAFFYFAALIMYLRFTDSKKKIHYILALVLFILSLLSKAMAVSLAPVLLIIDYSRGRPLLNRKVILEKIPFFILSLVFGIISILAQKSTWGEALSQVERGFFERFIFSVYSYIMYAVKLLVPFRLSGFYAYPALLDTSMIVGLVVTFILLAGIFYACIRLYRGQKREELSLVLFFTINIFFVLKLFEVPAGDYYMADRYSYVASTGILGLFAVFYIRMLNNSKGLRTLLLRAGIIIYAGAIFLTSMVRAEVWQDDESFFTDIIIKEPEQELGYTNRGGFRKITGNYEGAIQDFNKAIGINPGNFKNWANRGAVYLAKGDYKNAFIDYGKASELNPDNELVKSNLAFLKLNTGNPKEAVKDYSEVISQNPRNADAYMNRGTARFNAGDLEGAIADYSAALQINPQFFNAVYNRGLAYLNLRDNSNALLDFNTALKIKPGSAEVYANRAVLFSRLGRLEEAFRDYEAAISLKPAYFEPFLNRGIDRLYANDSEGAIRDLTAAANLNPKMGATYYYRGIALLNLKKQDDACADFRLALDLGFSQAGEAVVKYCR